MSIKLMIKDETRQHLVVLIVLTVFGLFISGCTSGPQIQQGNGIFSEANILWQLETDSSIISDPLINDNMAFLRTRNSIIALDLITGAEVWRTEVNGRLHETGTFKIVENRLIVPEPSGNVVALDLSTGQVLWEHCSICTGISDVNAIVANGNFVFVGRQNEPIYAYDLSTGLVQWSSYPRQRWLPYLFVIENSDVVYMTIANDFIIFDGATGAIQQEVDFGETYLGDFIVSGNYIYGIVSIDTVLHIAAIEFEASTLTWQQSTLGDGSLDYASITQGDDETLYINSPNGLLSVEANSQRYSENWSYYTEYKASKPVFLNEVVIFRTHSTLMAIDKTSGEQIGQMPTSSHLVDAYSSVAVQSNTLLLVHGRKELVALELVGE